MQTLPGATPNVKAFRATLRDEAGAVTKLDGEILFFHDGTGAITALEPEDCVWLCLLGEMGLSEWQALQDRRRGGAVGICLSRRQEVA
jgi:hypothetical protein